MKVFIVLRDDYEGGSDGHEWEANREVIGVRLTAADAQALVRETYGQDDPGDATYGVHFEEHEAT